MRRVVADPQDSFLGLCSELVYHHVTDVIPGVSDQIDVKEVLCCQFYIGGESLSRVDWMLSRRSIVLQHGSPLARSISLFRGTVPDLELA